MKVPQTQDSGLTAGAECRSPSSLPATARSSSSRPARSPPASTAVRPPPSSSSSGCRRRWWRQQRHSSSGTRAAAAASTVRQRVRVAQASRPRWWSRAARGRWLRRRAGGRTCRARCAARGNGRRRLCLSVSLSVCPSVSLFCLSLALTAVGAPGPAEHGIGLARPGTD